MHAIKAASRDGLAFSSVRAKLGWAGLGWAGLGWVVSDRIGSEPGECQVMLRDGMGSRRSWGLGVGSWGLDASETRCIRGERVLRDDGSREMGEGTGGK